MSRYRRTFPPRYARRMYRGGCAVFFIVPLTLLCVTSILLYGCTSKNKFIETNTQVQTHTESLPINNTTSYDFAIGELAHSISDTNQVYIDNIINERSSLSDESIRSIKTLTDAKTKKASDSYDKLIQMNGNKQDVINVLKKALDKLKLMDDDLSSYKDSKDNRSRLLSDWQIVYNYWKTYYEMTNNNK